MEKAKFLELLTEQVQDGKISDYDLPETLEGATLKLEDEWGGEGEGDKIGFVVKVSFPNAPEFYVSVNGYYDSYNGSDYSSAEAVEVVPYQKTVRDWKAV